MNYVIGGKYEVILRDMRSFQRQLADGTIATLSNVYVGFDGIWGNFEECKTFNYPLKYCRLVEAPSKLIQLITHVRSLDEHT